MSASVTIAPRELHDLVVRIARLDGFDPEAAEFFGRSVVAASVANHDGPTLFLTCVDTNTICDLLLARDALAEAEVDAHRRGTGSARLVAPVPDALLLHVLADTARRGAVRNASSSVDGRTTAITLTSTGRDSSSSSPPVQPIRLAEATLLELERRAAPFLVSEATLDALIDETG